MSDSVKDRLKTDLQTIKAEGTTRTTKIRDILQSAAAQSMTELKEGFGEIRSTANQSVSGIAQTLNDTETTEASSFSTVLNSIRTQFVNQAKIQLLNLDAKLATRYGVRYATAKQRLEQFQAWYNNSRTNAEAVGTTPVQQQQAAIELQIANQGTLVARKEQRIRQQVKEFLNTAIAKR